MSARAPAPPGRAAIESVVRAAPSGVRGWYRSPNSAWSRSSSRAFEASWCRSPSRPAPAAGPRGPVPPAHPSRRPAARTRRSAARAGRRPPRSHRFPARDRRQQGGVRRRRGIGARAIAPAAEGGRQRQAQQDGAPGLMAAPPGSCAVVCPRRSPPWCARSRPSSGTPASPRSRLGRVVPVLDQQPLRPPGVAAAGATRTHEPASRSPWSTNLKSPLA